MQIRITRTVEFSETEYASLLSILAYVGKLVEYKEGAIQHETIERMAVEMHTELAADGEYNRLDV